MVWEKLYYDPDWRIIIANYMRMLAFFLQKYHLMQKSTFSVIGTEHFKISVLQH